MPTLKEIRARIDSTKNTQQITRAMKLVSAAKLRRAQQNIVNMRPYAISLKRMIADIANSQSVSHPLMQRAHESKKVLFVVLTSDRGLCGAFNTNINKFAEAYWKQNNEHLEKMDFFFIGKKGADFFSKRGINGVESITKLDKDISYDLASHVADRVFIWSIR
jgi:F-type H+-transporting ATPase subunit gamma